MARLAYPEPEQLAIATQQVLAHLPARLNVFHMLAHAESALGPILVLGKAILGEQQLSPPLRELAILRVARLATADYEWVQHVPIAKAAGVSDEHIALVDRGDTEAPAFDAQANLVLRLASEVVAGPVLSDATFAALQAQFTPREIVELLLAIGYYLMLGRLMTALQIDMDAPAGNAVAEAARRAA
jgi:alkylhydroperoxidase family enzyme